MLHRQDLRVYQDYLVDKIKQCFAADPKTRLPGIIAALEPGAGKTAASLTAVKELHDDGLLEKVLVVAPLLVAQTTWPDEFGEWLHLQDLPFTLLRVEEDDPDVNAAGDAAYTEALVRHREAFEIERQSELLLGLSKGEARKQARALSGDTPASRAEKDRQEAVAKAKDAKLAQLADADTLIHIVNKEALRWLWDHFGRGARWPYDMMIVDDVRETRSGKKRVKREKDDGTATKAPLSRFGIMAAARKHMKATIVLTGTPTPRGLEDLWGLAYLVDLGERLLRFKTHFLKRWFHIDTRTFKAEPRDYAFGEIMPRVKDIMFSLDPADYPQLPPYQVVPIRVRLPDDVMKAYRKFKREMVSEEYDVEAVNGGVLHGKLLQFCIAEGTPVLTRRGWVSIQDVAAGDHVWDGAAWVETGGALSMGHRKIVDCFGVAMTPDHLVLTKQGWAAAQDILNGKPSIGLVREDVRLPDGVTSRGVHPGEEGHRLPRDVAGRMCVRQADCSTKSEPPLPPTGKDEVLRLSTRGSRVCRAQRPHGDQQPTLGDMAGSEAQMPKSEVSRLPQLRWPWDRHARHLVSILSGFLARCSDRLCGPSHARPTEQQRKLFAGKLSVGDHEGPDAEHSCQSDNRHSMGPNVCGGSGRAQRDKLCHALAADSDTPMAGAPLVRAGSVVAVYDLLDCGPRHRFTVLGRDGLPLIVHNCNGSMFREDGEDVPIHDVKIDALKTLVQELNGTPLLVAYTYRFDVDRIMAAFPKAVHLTPENAGRVVRDWNADKIPLLLCHRASAGHGLNMQKGTGHMCEYGLTADAELYLQFLKRIWRPGRKGTLFNHVIMSEGTIDDEIFPQYLDPKILTQMRVMEAVRVSFQQDALLQELL